jgi:peroxiredoxin
MGNESYRHSTGADVLGHHNPAFCHRCCEDAPVVGSSQLRPVCRYGDGVDRRSAFRCPFAQPAAQIPNHAASNMLNSRTSPGLVLLAGFSAVISVNVARGRHPACHCFGRLASAEVGWPAVARNALLAAVAGCVAADGRFLPVLAALAVLAAGAWLALAPGKPRPLRAGAAAPAFCLADQAGQKWTLESLLARGRPLLVFGDPACRACRELMPQVAQWQEELADELTVAVVSAGSPAEHRAAPREHGMRRLLADEDRSVTAAYRISATPSAVAVGAGRMITAGPAAGADEITALLAHAVAPDQDTMPGRRELLRHIKAGAAALTFPLLASACASARTARRAVRTAPFPGGAQYEKGLKQLGIPYRVPKACPTPARRS